MLIDAFRLSLYQELLSQIPNNVLYQNTDILLCKLNSPLLDLTNFLVSKPNVVIAHKDVLSFNEFDHWEQTISEGAQFYLDLANAYPETNFVFVVGLENINKEFTGKNIQTIRLGTSILDQKDGYQSLMPIVDKNFNSQQIFISLNRHARQHRINLVSYLLGLNLESFGFISFRDTGIRHSWLERCSWMLSLVQENTKKDILVTGYEKSKSLFNDTICDVDVIYKNRYCDNITNFNQHLYKLYQNSFVEIISETMFNTPHFGISEKFLNSVYGCNFPILIAGHGAVKLLDNIGFDMFHDVVDHSYDTIADPLDRLCAAIDNNIKLLTDQEFTTNLWVTHKQRFINNANFAKNNMYEIYKQRTIEDFNKIKWKV